MLPIAGLGIVLRDETSALLFGHGQVTVATVSTLTAATLLALLLGLVGPRDDRRPRPRVLRPPGHARHPVAAGIVAVVVELRRWRSSSAADSGLAGDRPRDRDRGVDRDGDPARSPPAPGTGAVAARPIVLVALQARCRDARRVPRSRSRFNGGLGAHRWRRARAPRRSPFDLTSLAAVGLGVYCCHRLALRIPELPSIVAVMADLLRRPRRA